MDRRHPVIIKDRRQTQPFGDFLAGFGTGPFRGFGEGPFIPRVEIREGDQDIIVLAELPGVEENDIHLSATKNMLTIEGEKKMEAGSGRGLYRGECFYGSFRREIPIPAEVNMDKTEAHFRTGVLHLTLYKIERAIAKPIPIKKSI